MSVAPTNNSTITLGGDISENAVGSALSLDDAGTLILSGSNGYTGGTYVNAGTLVVENSDGIPNGSSLTVGDGAATLFAAPEGGGVVLGGVELAAASGNSAEAPSRCPEPGMLSLLLAAVCSAAACRRFSKRSRSAR